MLYNRRFFQQKAKKDVDPPVTELTVEETSLTASSFKVREKACSKKA
jgi:hypothetical protein